MKTSQWVGGLAALVAVVFAVTYATMFVGTGERPPTQERKRTPKESPELTFTSETKFPKDFDGGASLDQEHKSAGYHDFWFKNANPAAVRVGAVSKSCKCQGIDVFVLPPGWQPPRYDASPRLAAGAVSGGAVGPLGSAAAAMAAAPTGEPVPVTAELETTARKVELNPNDSDAETDVPAQATGWVRMRWTGQNPGAQLLKAVLWMSDRHAGATTTLEVRAFFHHPVEVLESEHWSGVLATSDLPRTVTIDCWSPTRDHFGLTSGVAGGRPDLATDAFTVAAPVAMTREELATLERELAERAAKTPGGVREAVRSGYKVAVTLRKLAADGKTPFDLGNFRRGVRMTPDLPGIDPIVVYVSGTVRGDVTVGSGDERMPLQFGTFDRTKAPRRTVEVRSSVAGLELKLDPERLPDFLTAELTGPKAEGLTRTWRLEARVLPDKVPGGEFPPETAVYLRTLGPAPQTVRVPVGGNAVAGTR